MLEREVYDLKWNADGQTDGISPLYKYQKHTQVILLCYCCTTV